MPLSSRITIGTFAIVALLAGCTSRSGMLPSQSSQPASAGGRFTVVANAAASLAQPDACSDPKKLKVCLKPGGTYHLGLTLSCYLGTQEASCGTTKWSTKIVNKLIKGKFKPNPGDPTKETVTAAKSIKLGHYTQEITVTCTGVPSCDYTSKGSIWIIK